MSRCPRCGQSHDAGARSCSACGWELARGRPEALRTGVLERSFQLSRAEIDQEARTVPLSFSSEAPVERWFGREILDHSPGAVRLGRLRSLGPLLMDHDPRDHVGVCEDVSIGTDRRGRAVVRFGRSARAEEVFQDVADGIRGNVSTRYLIHAMRYEGEENDVEIYRATDWEPLEISLLSIPADTSVGVGRSAPELPTHETRILRPEVPAMRTCPHCHAPVSDAAAHVCPSCQRALAAAPAVPPVSVQPAPPAPADPARGADPVIAERTRISQIEELGTRYNQPELARQFRDAGGSLADFRAALLERMTPRPLAPPVREPVRLDLNGGEQRQFRITRALNLAAFGGSGFEREISDQIARDLRRETAGIFIPTNIPVRARAFELSGLGISADMVRTAYPLTTASGGSDAGGGYTVATVLLPLIELLRARMLVRQMGARVLSGLTSNVAFPRQTGAATLSWTGENPGSDVAESNATVDQVALTPKSAQATTQYSRQLLQQSSEDVEQFVRDDLTAINAQGLDLAAISGTGSSNQPTGILATTGIGAVVGGTNGAAPTWAHVVGLETEVAVDNADVGALGYLTNPKVRGKLRQTFRNATYGEDPIWSDAPGQFGLGMLNGYRAGVTTQVPSNLTKGSASGVCSAAIFGNWADLLIGEFGVIELIVDPYSAKKQGLIEVTSLMMADIAVRHPESFAAMKDILTT
jgi:HK97 family phage major capsid protein